MYIIESNYDINKHYKYGCVIAVYNRLEYFTKSIESIKNSIIPEDMIFIIIDDNSLDSTYLKNLEFNFNNIKIFKDKNLGVDNSIHIGWDLLFGLNVNYLFNLDSDTIVKKNWLFKLIELMDNQIFKNVVVTGFHTKVGGKHYMIKEYENFYEKYTFGGVNTGFKRMYYPLIRKAFTKNKHFYNLKNLDINITDKDFLPWDSKFMNICLTNKLYRLCTKPSVVNHIGKIGITSCPEKYDFALDWDNN